jgi:hypothetical protein
MGSYRIKRATANASNLATFEVDAAEPFEIGALVTVTGCTTTAFNVTCTVLTAGLCQVTPASTTGYSENWPGFTCTIGGIGAVATENEPATALASTGFATGVAGTSDITTHPE